MLFQCLTAEWLKNLPLKVISALRVTILAGWFSFFFFFCHWHCHWHFAVYQKNPSFNFYAMGNFYIHLLMHFSFHKVHGSVLTLITVRAVEETQSSSCSAKAKFKSYLRKICRMGMTFCFCSCCGLLLNPMLWSFFFMESCFWLIWLPRKGKR